MKGTREEEAENAGRCKGAERNGEKIKEEEDEEEEEERKREREREMQTSWFRRG